jgi:hypothetical protein
MQKAVLLTLLVTAAAMAATSVETGPTERVIPAWQHLWDGLVPVDQGQNDGTGSAAANQGSDRALTDRGGAGKVSESDDPNWQRPPCLWGDDILVGQKEYEYSGRISVDNDNETGDIYVCLLNRDPDVNDTAHIWRSTDGGTTWVEHPHVVGGASQGDIVDAQILCGHGPGDTTWLYFIEATNGAGLRVRRTTPDGSIFHWKVIDTTNTIVRVSVDRNTEDPEHLFVVWTEADGDIRARASSDAGETWPTSSHISSGRRGASFAAGGDGYGYVAYMDTLDSTFYRVGRFENDLVTPNWVFVNIDSAGNNRFREVAIAADRTAPGDSQVAVTLTTCFHPSVNNTGPRYAWTSNGGVSWSWSFWPVTNQIRETWLAMFPRIRRSYDGSLFRAIVSMRETTTSWDTIVYAYTRASEPDSWSDRAEPNDHRNTGEVSHDIGYSALIGGGFIAYREYGLGSVWFDGWDFVSGVGGDAPQVEPHRLIAVFGRRVNLTLPGRSRVSATLYDQSGRLVRELFNGTMDAGQQRLDPGSADGVSFLRVTIDGYTQTAKLVNLQ